MTSDNEKELITFYLPIKKKKKDLLQVIRPVGFWKVKSQMELEIPFIEQRPAEMWYAYP